MFCRFKLWRSSLPLLHLQTVQRRSSGRLGQRAGPSPPHHRGKSDRLRVIRSLDCASSVPPAHRSTALSDTPARRLRPGMRCIPSLDDPTSIRPTAHIWCGSGLSYFDTRDDLPRFDDGQLDGPSKRRS